MIYIQHQKNADVTDFYLETIARMIGVTENKYEYYDDLLNCKRNDIIIVPTIKDFLRAYLYGYKRIIYWMQGVDSEESYLKHKSKLRMLILDWLTQFTLKRAKVIFFVSEEMRKFEEKKFGLNLKEKSFIMPCFNVTKENMLPFNKSKYKSNIFCYVGSLSAWQCFEQTVEFYKKIENRYKDVELKVFTYSVEDAKKILLERKVKKFNVCYVESTNIIKALDEVKYGFVLRDDIVVNNVATPTKLSTYLAAGVIPIYSNCLIDFSQKTSGMNYFVSVDDFNKVPKKLERFIENDIDYDQLCKEYDAVFNNYYNADYYVSLYSESLKNLL